MGRFLKVFGQQPSFEAKGNLKIQSDNDPNFEKIKLKWLLDPREDLRRDSKLWVRILYNAGHFNSELFGVLHGIRCGGGQLTKTETGFRLLPGEWTVAEWEEIKQKYLDPLKDELIKIFKISRLGKVVNEELPEGLFNGQALQQTAVKAKPDDYIETHRRLIFGIDTIDSIGGKNNG